MKVEYSTHMLAEDQRLGFWHEAVSMPLMGAETDEICGNGAPFDAELKMWPVGDAMLNEVSAKAHRILRKGDRAGDGFCVILQRRGSNVYTDGRTLVEVDPGDVVVIDMSRPLVGVYGDVELVGLHLPRRHLSPKVSHPDRLHLLKVAGGPGSLAASYLSTLAELSSMEEFVGTAVIENLAGLLAIAAATTPEMRKAVEAGGGVKHARLQALLNHLDRNYSDPGLDPTAVAATFSMSVRYLHKLFEGSGTTFAEELTRRRLEAARAALADLGQGVRTVTQIAFDAGFNDLSNFGRRFRAAFGSTPRDYRAATLGSGACT